MIVAVISTSSPLASVALIRDGEIIGSKSENAPRAASGTSLKLLLEELRDNGLTIKDVNLFVADAGPGSFTGVKVGVTLAKTFAFALDKKCAGISAFDLIGEAPIAIPARKGQYFLKTTSIEVVPDADPRIQDATGYGASFKDRERFPDASRAESFLDRLNPVAPEELLPDYILEPSISQPKVPYKEQVSE